MADDVQITAGSGTTIATDDIGSGRQAQIVKLAAGVNGSAVMVAHLEDDAHVSGDAGIMALGVRKDTPIALPGADGDYGPLLLDSIGRHWVRPAPVQVRVQVTPTITTGAYTTGDNLGGLQDVANAARVSGGSGLVQAVTVLDRSSAQRAAMDLVFFDRSVSPGSDNAAFAASDADMVFCLGVIPIGPYNTNWPATVLNNISTMVNIGLPFVLNGTSLYVQAVVRGTPTYAVGDLTFSFTILQD